MDAYTLRKIAPRILIGVIGINLSIYLCLAAIDITNIIGSGIFNLITTPFDTASFGGNDGETAGGILSIIAVITVTFLAAATIFSLSGIFMLLLPMLLWFLVIIGVLVFRQGLLVLLTILSPIAIAAWLLPNTERYFKQWWEWFLKALMIYPIVAALFAISNALTTLYLDKARTGDEIALITGLIIAFAPLFMIPFAFQLSGGILSGISNMAKRPIAGVGKYSRAFAGGKGRQNIQGMKQGTRWKGNIPGTQRLSNRANIVARGAMSGPFRGRVGIGQRGRSAHAAAIEGAALGIQRDAKWNAMKDQDDALRAGTYNTRDEAFNGLRTHFMRREGLTEQEAETRASAAIDSWKGSGYSFGNTAAQVAAVRSMSETGTAHVDMQDMVQTISRVANGNEGIGSSLSGHANAVSKQLGRGGDLSPSFSTLNGLVQRNMSGDTPTQRDYDKATLKAAEEWGDPYSLARMSKPQVFNNLSAVQERVDRDTAITSDPEVLGELETMQDQLGARAAEIQTNHGALTAGQEADEFVVRVGALSPQAMQRARVGGRGATREQQEQFEQEEQRRREQGQPDQENNP